MFIPVGGTFGSVVNPSYVEPFTRARVHLTEAYSSRRDLLNKHEDIIDKLIFSENYTTEPTFVKTTPEDIIKVLKIRTERNATCLLMVLFLHKSLII